MKVGVKEEEGFATIYHFPLPFIPLPLEEGRKFWDRG